VIDVQGAGIQPPAAPNAPHSLVRAVRGGQRGVPDYDPAIESMVLHTLPANRFVDPASIALELNLIVWDADKALPRLVVRGTRVKILILKGHVSAACPQM
jgi:hypothetical protein